MSKKKSPQQIFYEKKIAEKKDLLKRSFAKRKFLPKFLFCRNFSPLPPQKNSFLDGLWFYLVRLVFLTHTAFLEGNSTKTLEDEIWHSGSSHKNKIIQGVFNLVGISLTQNILG